MDLSLVTNPPCVGPGPKARRTFDHERGGARRADVRTVAQGQRTGVGRMGRTNKRGPNCLMYTPRRVSALNIRKGPPGGESG